MKGRIWIWDGLRSDFALQSPYLKSKRADGSKGNCCGNDGPNAEKESVR